MMTSTLGGEEAARSILAPGTATSRTVSESGTAMCFMRWHAAMSNHLPPSRALLRRRYTAALCDRHRGGRGNFSSTARPPNLSGRRKCLGEPVSAQRRIGHLSAGSAPQLRMNGWETTRLESGAWDQRAGVYRLIGLEDTTGLSPAVIQRVCGNDVTGTLYIGAAEVLRNRIGSLVQTLRPDIFRSAPHKSLTAKLAARFPTDSLAISWEFSDRPWDRENELLQAYVAEFGELPPHNRRQ